MDSTLQGALIGAGGIVIGTLISAGVGLVQYYLTQNTENNKRAREVMEKRIDKVEELSTITFQGTSEIYYICEEISCETPNRELLNKLYNDPIEKIMKKDISENIILAANYLSIHDDKLTSLIGKQVDLYKETMTLFKSFNRCNPSDQINYMKSIFPKIEEIDTIATFNLSEIFERLDYLRAT